MVLKVTKGKLWLGLYLDEEGRRTDKKFEISVDLLRRHGGVFGSTGSGKTVLSKAILEEAALQGIPVIAMDPQGDIASLMIPGDPKELEAKGVDPARLKEYLDKVIVRVYTPASSKGLAVSINPLKLPDKNADPDDMVRLMDNSARTLVKVLSKVAGLSRSWESKSFAVLYELLRTTWENDVKVKDLAELANLLVAPLDEVGVDLEPYMKQSEREKLATSIRSLTVGSSQLLFREEGQIDFDELIRPVDGKTPINVLFLKTLRSEEEKHFFIAIVLNQLYSWMLRQGFTEHPRLVLFQDEAAPFIPAGMKSPGPKETFLLLFRQARKYGVECLVATQSPKDVDYKAFEQTSLIASGRISSHQSLKVLERVLEPIAGENGAEEIITQLPAQPTASFIIASADMMPRVNHVGVRWLLTKHITLTERDVQKHMAELKTEQEKVLRRMEKQRIEHEREEENARRRLAEERKRKTEQEERLKKEKAARKQREAVLAAERERFSSVDADAKVFETKGKTGKVSYEDIINAFIARIEAVARTTFGLPFLKELVKRETLLYEKALSFYLKETKAAIKHGLAKRTRGEYKGRKTWFIEYDFDHVIVEILKATGIKEPEYVDKSRLKSRFEELVKNAEKNNFLDRIVLGKPFLEF